MRISVRGLKRTNNSQVIGFMPVLDEDNCLESVEEIRYKDLARDLDIGEMIGFTKFFSPRINKLKKWKRRDRMSKPIIVIGNSIIEELPF